MANISKAFHATVLGRAVRVIVITTGPRPCFACVRRAIGTANVYGRIVDACGLHADDFAEVACG